VPPWPHRKEVRARSIYTRMARIGSGDETRRPGRCRRHFRGRNPGDKVFNKQNIQRAFRDSARSVQHMSLGSREDARPTARTWARRTPPRHVSLVREFLPLWALREAAPVVVLPPRRASNVHPGCAEDALRSFPRSPRGRDAASRRRPRALYPGGAGGGGWVRVERPRARSGTEAGEQAVVAFFRGKSGRLPDVAGKWRPVQVAGANRRNLPPPSRRTRRAPLLNGATKEAGARARSRLWFFRRGRAC
jgi:hypothetical protein